MRILRTINRIIVPDKKEFSNTIKTTFLDTIKKSFSTYKKKEMYKPNNSRLAIILALLKLMAQPFRWLKKQANNRRKTKE